MWLLPHAKASILPVEKCLKGSQLFSNSNSENSFTGACEQVGELTMDSAFPSLPGPTPTPDPPLPPEIHRHSLALHCPNQLPRLIRPRRQTHRRFPALPGGAHSASTGASCINRLTWKLVLTVRVLARFLFQGVVWLHWGMVPHYGSRYAASWVSEEI